MGQDDLEVEPADLDDDVDVEELGDEPFDAELELLAARVRAARFAGA